MSNLRVCVGVAALATVFAVLAGLPAPVSAQSSDEQESAEQESAEQESAEQESDAESANDGSANDGSESEKWDGKSYTDGDGEADDEDDRQSEESARTQRISRTDDDGDDESEAGDADEAPGSEDGDDTSESGVVIGSNQEGDSPGWRLELGGYMRTRFTAIENDPDVDFVGRHDGFSLADARLELDGRLEMGLGFHLEFDGAVERTAGTVNSPRVDLVTRLKDAFTYYQPFGPLRISAGQFKPPYDIEELTSNSELLFVHESVGSRGVQGVEGYNVDGLSLDRQAGLQVDGDPWFPLADGDEPSGPGASYALAVTNGSSAFQNLNDNDRLAYYGRANLHWGEYVRAGGAYSINNRTRGERPDRVGVDTHGWTADLTVDAFGVTAIGSIMERTETPFGGEHAEGEVTARALQGQIAYEEPFLGFQPAYRYAWYDPSHDYDSDLGEGGFDTDTRTQHTFGLNYNAKDYPVRVMLNYTLAQQQDERQLDNNRFDALLQLTW